MKVFLTTPDIEQPERVLRGDELAAFKAGKEVAIFDQECRGLVLRVHGRKKAFQARYSFPGIGRQTKALGHFKSEISLEGAREAVRKIRADAKQGKHHKVTEAETANESSEWLACPTYADFAIEFIRDKSNQQGDDRVRDKTLKEMTRYLTSELSDPIKPMRLHQITRRAIAAQLRIIAKDSAANAKGWLTYVKQVFNSAQTDHAYVDINPAEGLKAPTVKARERIFSSDELGELLRETAGDDEEHSKIVRLILFLGGRRPGEVGGMRRSEINGNVWTIPAERHKTGRKSKKPIVLPLLPEVLKIIESMPVEKGREDFVFSSRFEDSDAAGWKYDKAKLDERLKLPAWQLRDLRRTAATLMQDGAGVDVSIVKKLTNHVGRDGRDVFDKVYDKSKRVDPKTEALRSWIDYLHRLAGDNVTALRAAA